jgi:hypothetical protein
MRSMVEREAQAIDRNALPHRRQDLAQPFNSSASRSTTRRAAPLSQEGEE